MAFNKNAYNTGGHGGHGAPHGPAHAAGHGPAHAPISIDTTREPDMDHVLGAMQDTWTGRLKNFGAGGIGESASAWDKTKNIAHGATTVLSGGLLGSYGLGAKGSLNKELDRLVVDRTGIDWNSSLRVSDIWRSASLKIVNISEKVRLCEEMEQYIDTYIAGNGLAVAAAGRVKGSSGREIAHSRNRVGELWGFAKAHPKVAGVAGLVGAGTTIAFAGPLLAVGAVMSPSLMAVSRLMEINKGKFADVSVLKADPDKLFPVLMKVRRALSVIRADAEQKRAALLAKEEKKYKYEVANFKRIKTQISGLKGRIGEHAAHSFVEQLEAAFNAPDIPDALNTLANNLQMARDSHGNVVLPAGTIDKLRKDFRALTSGKGVINKIFDHTYVGFHNAMLDSIGTPSAKGPDAIGGLIHRLAQVNALHSLRGRQVELGAAPHNMDTFTIQNIVEQGGAFSLELERHGEVATIDVIRSPRGTRMVLICDLVPPLQDILSELHHNTDHDLHLNNDPAFPDAAKKALLKRAKTELLDFADYAKLLSAFAHHHPPTLQAMVAAGRHERKRDLIPDAELIIK